MTERKFRGNTLGPIAKDGCVIINLEDPSSWPTDLVIYLERHRHLFVGWENGAQGKGTSVLPQKFDRAICGLCDVLKSHSLIGWHCTRLTQDEIEAITTSGMTPPDAQMLTARIDALAKAGVITADIAKKLCAENQADNTNRAGTIWLCFFPPHIAGESGIERFFRSWGGEALYNSHEDDPQTGLILAGIGVPCLVEAEVPIVSLPTAVGLALKIYRRFLVSKGHRSVEPLDHVGRATRPLPPDSIRRIIRFPEPDFVRLTKCDEWDVPLPQP
jgi:hypothetical protein